MSMAQPFHCVSMVARIVLQNGSWHHHADIIYNAKYSGIYLYYMSVHVYIYINISVCVCAYLCFNIICAALMLSDYYFLLELPTI